LLLQLAITSLVYSKKFKWPLAV